jgi:hypothetical protein
MPTSALRVARIHHLSLLSFGILLFFCSFVAPLILLLCANATLSHGDMSILYVCFLLAIAVYYIACASDTCARYRTRTWRWWRFNPFRLCAWRPGISATVWVLYVCVPVILNGASVVLRASGFEHLADTLFRNRFAPHDTLAVFYAIAFVCGMLVLDICSNRPWKKK